MRAWGKMWALAGGLLSGTWTIFKFVQDVLGVVPMRDDGKALWDVLSAVSQAIDFNWIDWTMLSICIATFTYLGFEGRIRERFSRVSPNPEPEIELESAPDPEPSPAAQAFEASPFLGKRAANYILEQTSADEAETILWTLRRQPNPVDQVFAEAAWVELLSYLGDERAAQANYEFGFNTTEEPRKSEAEKYAKQFLSTQRVLGREKTPISDQKAVEANPGNGWRVHRLILDAATAGEVAALYQDFMSQPHKSREALVFATYHMKISKLDGDSLGDCWTQMTAAAWKHGSEFMIPNFQKQVIEEAGAIQRNLWPN